MSSELDKIARLCRDAYQRGFKDGATATCDQVLETVKIYRESVNEIMENK